MSLLLPEGLELAGAGRWVALAALGPAVRFSGCIAFPGARAHANLAGRAPSPRFVPAQVGSGLPIRCGAARFPQTLAIPSFLRGEDDGTEACAFQSSAVSWLSLPSCSWEDVFA